MTLVFSSKVTFNLYVRVKLNPNLNFKKFESRVVVSTQIELNSPALANLNSRAVLVGFAEVAPLKPGGIADRLLERSLQNQGRRYRMCVDAMVNVISSPRHFFL